MAYDPLTIFAQAKMAAAKAPDTPAPPKKEWTLKDADPNSPDPGERGIAAVMGFGGGLIGRTLKFALEEKLKSDAYRDSIPTPRSFFFQVPGTEIEAAKSVPSGRTIKEIIQKTQGTPTEFPQRSRLLGVFDVSARPQSWPKTEKAFIGAAKEPYHAYEKLKDMQKSVDGFIAKHQLAEKGVTINPRRGPITYSAKSNYNPLTKRVTLDRIGKAHALHELGHAADYTGSRIGKARRFIEPLLLSSARVAIPAAIIAGDQIKELIPGSIDDKAIDFMQRNAPALVAGTLAATKLYPELKASILAARYIRETEGPKAAREMIRRTLRPGFQRYLVNAIPAVIGMSLAKRYMANARKEKEDKAKLEKLKKTAGLADIVAPTLRALRSNVKDLTHVGRQIGRQSADIVYDGKVLSSLGRAAKTVGTSPQFAFSAYSAGVPAALASLYFYGAPSGKIVRKHIHEEELNTSVPMAGTKKVPLVQSSSEDWREKHPLRYAGLVGLGAAFAGGVMSKLYADLARVL